jgi:hypothetical protein
MRRTHEVSVWMPPLANLRLVTREPARLGRTAAGVAVVAALAFLLLQPYLRGTEGGSLDSSRSADRSALSALASDVVLVSKPSSGSGLGSIRADVPVSSAHLQAVFAALAVPWARGGFRVRGAAMRVHVRGPLAR